MLNVRIRNKQLLQLYIKVKRIKGPKWGSKQTVQATNTKAIYKKKISRGNKQIIYKK